MVCWTRGTPCSLQIRVSSACRSIPHSSAIRDYCTLNVAHTTRFSLCGEFESFLAGFLTSTRFIPKPPLKPKNGLNGPPIGRYVVSSKLFICGTIFHNLISRNAKRPVAHSSRSLACVGQLASEAGITRWGRDDSTNPGKNHLCHFAATRWEALQARLPSSTIHAKEWLAWAPSRADSSRYSRSE